MIWLVKREWLIGLDKLRGFQVQVGNACNDFTPFSLPLSKVQKLQWLTMSDIFLKNVNVCYFLGRSFCLVWSWKGFSVVSMNILYLQRGPSSHCNKSWWISPLYKVSVWVARSTCIYILSFCWVVNLVDNYYKSVRQSSQPHMYLYWWWEI